MATQIYLPSELLELLSSYLPNQQQYQCLFVSKSWYGPNHRSLYKRINVNTRYQLRSLFNQLDKKGSLVREIYLNKSQNNIVGITRKELDQLAHLCPYLEILDFDQRIWKYIQQDSAKMMNERFEHMKQLPTLTRNIPTLSPNLTCLNLKGKIVSDLFYNGEMVSQVLNSTPKLKYLKLDSQQDVSHVIHISLSEMELIHKTLPHLQELVMIGSFKFNASHVTQQQIEQVPVSLTMERFSLSKVTLPYQWIYYFAHKYPLLQELDFELVHNDADKKQLTDVKKEEIQNLFSILSKSCPRLRKIELDSWSAKIYLTKQFFDGVTNALKEIKLKSLPYNVVTRGSEGFFDLLIEEGRHLITSLATEVIGSDIDVTSITGSLSRLPQLNELELHCGHLYFNCEVDLILKACPKLRKLTIRAGSMNLSSNMNTEMAHPLESIYLSDALISSSVFEYLGKTCKSLDTIGLYECEQENENVLDIKMPENNFKEVTLNGIRLKTVSLDSDNNARFLCIQTETQERWYYANNRKSCHSSIQRLNRRKSSVAQNYHNNGVWINNNGNDDERDSWTKDLVFGQIALECKSIKKWELIYQPNYNEF